MRLRTRVKDLNLLVEKALEKSQSKIAKQEAGGNPIAASFDPEHLLAIRQKEI